MKKVLYFFVASSFCVAMPPGAKFEQFQPKFKELKYYSNQHFTQKRFNRENWHTRNHLRKQRDYTPSPKGR